MPEKGDTRASARPRPGPRRRAIVPRVSLRARFERFADAGDKHAFRLRDGREFLGWIVEVADAAVLVAWAPSPFHAQATGTAEMSPPDEWLALTDIEPGSLAWWDSATRRWVEFA